ncbi:MAG: hypothetical protein IPH51_12700 [Rubrivivax sp.]|nr:hypothetical protein [Rubrivivax sp.]
MPLEELVSNWPPCSVWLKANTLEPGGREEADLRRHRLALCPARTRIRSTLTRRASRNFAKAPAVFVGIGIEMAMEDGPVKAQTLLD